MFEAWQVREALRSRFGSALVDQPGFADPPAAILSRFEPDGTPFHELAAALEDSLFNGLYEHLGPSMTAVMDDGSIRRIRTGELAEAADDVMGVLFDTLNVDTAHYTSLHAYCMVTGSFSALRVLYTRFRDLTPPSERAVFARIIRENWPRSRWETGLFPGDS